MVKFNIGIIDLFDKDLTQETLLSASGTQLLKSWKQGKGNQLAGEGIEVNRCIQYDRE